MNKHNQQKGLKMNIEAKTNEVKHNGIITLNGEQFRKLYLHADGKFEFVSRNRHIFTVVQKTTRKGSSYSCDKEHTTILL